LKREVEEKAKIIFGRWRRVFEQAKMKELEERTKEKVRAEFEE